VLDCACGKVFGVRRGRLVCECVARKRLSIVLAGTHEGKAYRLEDTGWSPGHTQGSVKRMVKRVCESSLFFDFFIGDQTPDDDGPQSPIHTHSTTSTGTHTATGSPPVSFYRYEPQSNSQQGCTRYVLTNRPLAQRSSPLRATAIPLGPHDGRDSREAICTAYRARRPSRHL
jgi:hypothetical protein